MKTEHLQRLRPLLLWKILHRETDEAHPITTQQLLTRLEQCGLPCERRALERDMEALIALGEPIVRRRGASYAYYMDTHTFTDGELDILLDCLQASAFLTEDATWTLMQKVAPLGGGGKAAADAHTDNVLLNSVHKTDNAQVTNTVTLIGTAIGQQKKLAFHYFDRDENNKRRYRTNERGEQRRYVVSPLKRTIKDGFYYLLAMTENESKIRVYRIDRMTDAAVLEEDFDPVEQNIDPADIEQYKKRMFGMFTGTETTVRLRVHHTLVNMVFDVFGAEEPRLTADGDFFTFTCNVVLSPAFLGWCCSFGDKVQLLAPQSVVEQLAEYARGLVAMYPGRE